MYVVIMKSESGDEYHFSADRKLKGDEIDLFIQTNIPHEYDEEEDVNYIYDVSYIELNKLTKIK